MAVGHSYSRLWGLAFGTPVASGMMVAVLHEEGGLEHSYICVSVNQPGYFNCLTSVW